MIRLHTLKLQEKRLSGSGGKAGAADGCGEELRALSAQLRGSRRRRRKLEEFSERRAARTK
jgi:hypothetical protein